MAQNNYLFGLDETTLLGDAPKYFYGLRRTKDGDLYFGKYNTLQPDELIVVNNNGPAEEDYSEFEYGVDYVDNIDENHNIIYENLYFSQYRWDTRSMYYYIDDNGSFIARIAQKYTYEEEL